MEASVRVHPGCMPAYSWLSYVYRKQKKYHKIVGLKLLYIRQIKLICQEQARLQELTDKKTIDVW